MKRIIIAMMALLSTAVLSSFVTMEHRKEDKSIETLWTEYGKALQQDRVRKMSGILEEIKAEALHKRSGWDYYRACSEYVEVKARGNWKLRDSLQKQMRNEIMSYDDPLLIYLMDRNGAEGDDILGYVMKMRERLERNRNKDIYDGRGGIVHAAVRPLIGNDYEYALWDMFRQSSYGCRDTDHKEKVYALLKKELGDSYPKSGIAEYSYVMGIQSDQEREIRLKELADRYDGRALALLPSVAMMENEFRKNRNAGSAEYFLNLKKRLESYEHERKTYRSGSDKLIAEDCLGFERMLDQLESKAVFVTVRNGEAELALRNLDEVKVRIFHDDEKVFESVLENPQRSFYKLDTLSLVMPSLDDGDYRIVCYEGYDEVGQCHYPKYTLSVATRSDDLGKGVYVADYLSGEPLAKVDMALYKGDGKVAEASGVELDGFTVLPRELSSRLSDVTYGQYLVCSCIGEDGTVRRSQDVYLFPDEVSYVNEKPGCHASVMLDRAAFNPGETVKFKAVMYEDSSDGGMRVMPDRVVSVKLRDGQGNVLAEKDLMTNEFGSVAGDFRLDGIMRNGSHFIDVLYGNERIGSAVMTVDEYVLPTFDVSFEKNDRVFLPGDTIDVDGKVTSYSGHSVSSASVIAKVTYGEKLVMQASPDIDSDGCFRITFNDESADDDRYPSYVIEVVITDLTGETRSFRHYQNVMKYPVISIDLQNPAEGSFRTLDEERGLYRLLSDDVARLSFGVSYQGGGHDPLPLIPLKYSLIKDDEIVKQGEAVSAETAKVDFSGLESGLYKLVAEVVLANSLGEKIEGKRELVIVKVRDDEKKVDSVFENIFHVIDGEDPCLQIGAGCGPVWAVVELYDDREHRLEAEILYLDKGEMKTLMYDYESDYPDALVLNVLYFRNSDCYTYTHTWRRKADDNALPLEFVRFEDVAAPGTSCSVALKTIPDSEVLVSVFDVSTEQIRKNSWADISAGQPYVATVGMNGVPGMNGSGYAAMMGFAIDETAVVGYGTTRRKGNRADMLTSYTGTVNDSASTNVIRDDFAASLAFEPFLRPSEDGAVTLDFATSDKISTFVVSVFAHDKFMSDNVLRREMLVTLPVKLSVAPPLYLYEGDRYVLRASLSNNSAYDVSGKVTLEGSAEVSCDVSVPAGGSIPVSFEVLVPSGTDSMDLRVVFSGGNCTDGVLVNVPVYPASQEVVESYSAVLLHGMSEEEVVGSLRERFVNVPAAGTEYEAVAVMDMLREALPLTVEAKGKDAISQSEAMYVNLLAGGLHAAEGQPVRVFAEAAMNAASRIVACSNSDGGFGWFEGMKSSPVVTAVILERFAGLRDRKLLNVVFEEFGEDVLDDLDEAVISAVRYLDSVYFGDRERPSWYGNVSLWQYLDIRARFVGVPFDEAEARKMSGIQKYNEFRKTVRSCLIPGKGGRWTDGEILQKVRIVRVLDALCGSDMGMALAKAWGVSSVRKIRRSMKTELESLKEYAVEHPSGGIYYPNAVLPWRGLLESEAYAHAMICDLYESMSSDEEFGEELDSLADGIRLWIMLQKETQQWSSDPGFIEALASAYDGSEAVKDTKVIVVSKRGFLPFEEIEAAGNGFKVSVSYYVEESAEGEKVKLKPVSEGDTLHVGDKVIAKYSVWSEENRSFVRLCVPRPACFRPENQLSGWSRGLLSPLSYGSFSVSPYAYREVKADRTLYWIDVFPEENSTIEETFFVTQEGCFSSPVPEVGSLYAPHYRANDNSSGSYMIGSPGV